jgi:glycosyltransferase involved in cell wall biosynthesis
VRRPAASVLMAARDAGRHLELALRSVLEQSVEDLEVVVVDDGSRDETPDILEAAERADPRVRVLRLEDRAGLALALNRGLDVCRAGIVVRMDADDVALPDRIERQLDFLTANPGIVLVGGQALLINEDGQEIGRARRPATPLAVLWHSLLENPFIHPAVAVRRSALEQVGGYSASFRTGQDYELWHRVLQLGGGANLQVPVLRYRRVADGTTASRREEQLRSHREVSNRRVAAVVGDSWTHDSLELLRRSFVSPDFGAAPPGEEGRAVALYRRLGRAFCDAQRLDARDRRRVRGMIARRVAGSCRWRGATPVLAAARSLPRYPTLFWDLLAATYTDGRRR